MNIEFPAIQPGPIGGGPIVYDLRVALVVIIQIEKTTFGSGQQSVFLAGESRVKKVDIADFSLSLDGKSSLGGTDAAGGYIETELVINGVETVEASPHMNNVLCPQNSW